jgi:gamma-glutamylcyclotransferase (GGCT)/AIG2-like uncharacterized protein YtfP
MYSLGAFPMCVLGDKSDSITGECYEIDEETLRHTDQLEGFPRFYNRIKTIAQVTDGTIWDGWIYFGENKPMGNSTLVKNGTWERDTWNS